MGEKQGGRLEPARPFGKARERRGGVVEDGEDRGADRAVFQKTERRLSEPRTQHAVLEREVRAERHARAREVLEQVGLGDKLKNRPNQLSGGQQQRVSIARALVRNPPVILADEPTGALDSHTGREVLGLLQQLHKQGHTVVLITHDHSIAVQADRIIRLEDGRVVYDGDSHAPEAMVQPTLLPETPEKEEQA